MVVVVVVASGSDGGHDKTEAVSEGGLVCTTSKCLLLPVSLLFLLFLPLFCGGVVGLLVGWLVVVVVAAVAAVICDLVICVTCDL